MIRDVSTGNSRAIRMIMVESALSLWPLTLCRDKDLKILLAGEQDLF